MYLRSTLVLLTCIAILTNCALAKTSSNYPNLPQELTFEDLSTTEGKSVSPENILGKVTILTFWAPWCFECVQELSQFEALSQGYGPEGLRIIGVAVATPRERVSQFSHTHSFSFPLYIDEGNVFSNALHITALPTTLILDQHGFVRIFPSRKKGTVNDRVEGIQEWLTPEAQEFLRMLLVE